MTCEKCWNDAFVMSQRNGRTQADNYAELVRMRKDNPCGTPHVPLPNDMDRVEAITRIRVLIEPHGGTND